MYKSCWALPVFDTHALDEEKACPKYLGELSTVYQEQSVKKCIDRGRFIVCNIVKPAKSFEISDTDEKRRAITAAIFMHTTEVAACMRFLKSFRGIPICTAKFATNSPAVNQDDRKNMTQAQLVDNGPCTIS
jgi:hypothetical protein